MLMIVSSMEKSTTFKTAEPYREILTNCHLGQRPDNYRLKKVSLGFHQLNTLELLCLTT